VSHPGREIPVRRWQCRWISLQKWSVTVLVAEAGSASADSKCRLECLEGAWEEDDS